MFLGRILFFWGVGNDRFILFRQKGIRPKGQGVISMSNLLSNKSESLESPTVASAPRYRLTPNVRSEAAERRKIEHDLRQALSLDQMVLYYQPRLSLLDGQRVGAEALIRWPHRKRGLLSPAAFLPVAERTTLITRLGGWVLRNACSEAAHWPEGGIVSVNVSARQLSDGAILDQVAEALDISGLAPERLELDLVESVLIEADVELLLTLSSIRDLGVGLAVDDFGTGYTSLGMLKRAPLTTMKIDRSLIRCLPGDGDAGVILRAVVETGHALGLTVLAEGIETEEQLSFLSATGCDEGQGFLFSHPLPAAHLFPLAGWATPEDRAA
jgi:EAL domain-containing protein (putative c-di-GMP-specific phosphodiesterase class I)